eukprot:scaffold52055_cov39-Tisochrysis_lutea.AAC.1
MSATAVRSVRRSSRRTLMATGPCGLKSADHISANEPVPSRRPHRTFSHRSAVSKSGCAVDSSGVDSPELRKSSTRESSCTGG